MSWLSSLFSSNDHTADVNAANAARQAQEEQARRQADDERRRQEEDFARRRTEAGDTGRQSAMRYFTDRGIDPSGYGGDIEAEIQRALSSVASNDPAPGAYLQDIGKTVYGNKLNASREQALRGVNQTFTPGFERSRFSDTYDDPFIDTALKGQQEKADSYITNLLKRGVVTDTGAAGARTSLAGQDSRVRDQLDELGQNVLSTGRQGLTDVANRARGAASTLDLGGSFDPSKYAAEADQYYNDFAGKFGDKFKALVPNELYDTSGLASAAGISQGGQNTQFDPQALAGLASHDQAPAEEDPTNPTKKKRTLF